MKPKKKLGQNFLVDQQVIEDLLKAAKINERDIVLEVGAGTGAVTRPLAERAGKVLTVEIDKNLIPQLQANLKGLENVEVVNEDILKLDTNHYPLAANFKVVGSIPYQITSPLIHKLLKLKNRPKSITIIVQKEVAEKIVAKPPKANYSERSEEQGSRAPTRGSYLSNFVANFGRAEIIRTIEPNAFRPQPKVDSAILHIALYPRPYTLDPRFESFLHHGFAQPRKMLNKQFSAETLRRAEIDPKRRPQSLSFAEWIKLFGERNS